MADSENNQYGKLVYISNKPYQFIKDKQTEHRKKTGKNISLGRIIEEYIQKTEGNKYDISNKEVNQKCTKT